ncbi:MAG: D-alanyl-D-alanine carboxypeptidase [Chthoniobacterales bacterium]|nr:D-alanyl-D-alanine carboxypeptidase [Chthoniobacterales bacterium]
MKFLFSFFLFAVIAHSATPPPNVGGASVVVIDANNGNTLYSRNPNEQRPVGSTQKLLTALVIVERGDLNHLVTIQPIDEKTEPTMLGLKPGEQYTRQQLLTALLVKSPNDVARALARDEAGSFEAFAVLMNNKAAELGMRSSHFVNPNGLPAPDQYSTAADMAKLAYAVYHNPLLRSIIATKYYYFRKANGTVEILKNTNSTMQRNSFCNGMKTGYTNKSQHCLLSSGSYQGHDAITVILGCTDRHQLFNDTTKLLCWALGIPLTTVVPHQQHTAASPAPVHHHRYRKKRKYQPQGTQN